MKEQSTSAWQQNPCFSSGFSMVGNDVFDAILESKSIPAALRLFILAVARHSWGRGEFSWCRISDKDLSSALGGLSRRTLYEKRTEACRAGMIQVETRRGRERSENWYLINPPDSWQGYEPERTRPLPDRVRAGGHPAPREDGGSPGRVRAGVPTPGEGGGSHSDKTPEQEPRKSLENLLGLAWARYGLPGNLPSKGISSLLSKASSVGTDHLQKWLNHLEANPPVVPAGIDPAAFFLREVTKAVAPFPKWEDEEKKQRDPVLAAHIGKRGARPLDDAPGALIWDKQLEEARAQSRRPQPNNPAEIQPTDPSEWTPFQRKMNEASDAYARGDTKAGDTLKGEAGKLL